MQFDLRDNPIFLRSMRGVLTFVEIMGYSLLIMLWLVMGACLGMALYVQGVMGVPESVSYFYRLAFLFALAILAVHMLTGLWPFRLGARQGKCDKDCVTIR